MIYISQMSINIFIENLFINIDVFFYSFIFFLFLYLLYSPNNKDVDRKVSNLLDVNTKHLAANAIKSNERKMHQF